MTDSIEPTPTAAEASPATPGASVTLSDHAARPDVSWWKRAPRAAIVAASIAAVLMVAAAIIIPVTIANASNPFADALTTCNLEGSTYVRLADDGKTLTVDGGGLTGVNGLGIKDQGCLNKALKVPESVVTEMLSTRALDGVQKETFGDVSARWTYHPDNGLDVIFTRK